MTIHQQHKNTIGLTKKSGFIALYDVWPGNREGHILIAPRVHTGLHGHYVHVALLHLTQLQQWVYGNSVDKCAPFTIFQRMLLLNTNILC